MDKHVTLLGALHLAWGVLLFCAAAIAFVAIAGGGMISQDPVAMQVTMIVAICVAGFLALLSLPGIAAGAGLLKRRPWARILALVVGAVNLVNVPLGTALGIYTFWVLMQDGTARLFVAPSRSEPV